MRSSALLVPDRFQTDQMNFAVRSAIRRVRNSSETGLPSALSATILKLGGIAALLQHNG
jgi:hypothetical protein